MWVSATKISKQSVSTKGFRCCCARHTSVIDQWYYENYYLLGSVFGVQLHPNGELAVSGREDDKAFVWRTTDCSVMFEYTGMCTHISVMYQELMSRQRQRRSMKLTACQVPSQSKSIAD